MFDFIIKKKNVNGRLGIALKKKNLVVITN